MYKRYYDDIIITQAFVWNQDFAAAAGWSEAHVMIISILHELADYFLYLLIHCLVWKKVLKN